MPPHENPFGSGQLVLEDGTPVEINTVTGLYTDEEPFEAWQPITGGSTFTLNARVMVSRKKLSRRSDHWRWMKDEFEWSYRERRRAIRRAEKKRRETVKCLHGKSSEL